MDRLAYDNRFTTEEVLKNFDKWENDMQFLCDNDKELETAWASDEIIFEKEKRDEL